MKAKLPHIARILLGLIFFVFGLIGLLNLVPPPPDLPERLQVFNAGLEASGYFIKLLKITETLCGLLLLINMWVPLSLVVLAPIALNIFLVHAFMAPEGLVIAFVIGILMIYLSFFAQPYAGRIRPLFDRKC